MSLKQQAFQGLIWNSMGQYSSQFVRIVITMILARLITPAQFGLVAMITVVSGFSLVLIDFGFRQAIIQNKEVKEIDLHSIFWTNTIIGACITLALIIAAPLFATFYNEPQLLPLTQIVAFTYVISALQIVPSALLAKELDFKRLAFPKFFATIVSGGIAIILAVMGLGAKALAIQMVLASFFSVLFIYGVSAWRPKFRFSKQAVAKYAGLSFSLSTNSSLHYVATNTDDLLVGKLFGQSQLGLYSKAFAVISLPAESITKILTAVFFSSFSKIQDEKQTIAKYYLKLTKLVSMFSFPLMILIFIFAHEFVLLVFGNQWLAAVPYVKIFSICGLIASINSMLGPVIVSQGRQDLIWKEVFLKRPAVIIAVFIGSFFSVLAIAIGKLIADVFNLFVTFWQIKNAIEIPIVQQISALKNVAISSVLLICCIVVCKYFLPATTLVQLLSVIIGLVSYALCLVGLETRLVKEVLNELKNSIR